MASVRDIARQVGVSAATVSRAINSGSRVTPEVRRKVLAAMNRARYVPKIGVRATTYVAFAYAGPPSLGSPFDAALVQGISDRLGEHGFDLVILDLNRAKLPNETYSQMFMRKGIRGAVLRTNEASRQVCVAIAEEGFPSVVAGDRFDNKIVSFVHSESRESSHEAVDHLIALGHRQIAISVNSVEDTDHADRLAGYRAALESHDIPVDAKLIFQAVARRDGGVQLIRRMFGSSKQRPTAVYATDPMTAVGAIAEAQEMGIRVPQDLSIVGFDDAEIRFLTRPQMTAVCQDAAAIGREASIALHAMIERSGKNAVVRLALPTVFELHGSTAPPATSTGGKPPPKSRTHER
jgi:DNA-binding LacI/PurR family transcriptional regulator